MLQGTYLLFAVRILCYVSVAHFCESSKTSIYTAAWICLWTPCAIVDVVLLLPWSYVVKTIPFHLKLFEIYKLYMLF